MKKLLSVLLIFVLIFSFCSCSSLSSDEKDAKSLLGSWECNPDLTNETLFTLVFQDDGTASFNVFGIDSTFDKYYCEDNVLYLESSTLSTSIKMAYRFSDDKDTLYLSEIDGNDEVICHRTNSDTSNNNKKEKESLLDKSTYDFTLDEELVGTWELIGQEGFSEDTLIFNDDGTGSDIGGGDFTWYVEGNLLTRYYEYENADDHKQEDLYEIQENGDLWLSFVDDGEVYLKYAKEDVK